MTSLIYASGSANYAEAVTPHDTNPLSRTTRGVWVGTAGNITVDFAGGGTNVALTNIPAGSLLPISVTRIYSTGTTASGIVGLS